MTVTPIRKLTPGQQIARDVLREDTPRTPLEDDILGKTQSFRFTIPAGNVDEMERALHLIEQTCQHLRDEIDASRKRRSPDYQLLPWLHRQIRMLHTKLNSKRSGLTKWP